MKVTLTIKATHAHCCEGMMCWSGNCIRCQATKIVQLLNSGGSRVVSSEVTSSPDDPEVLKASEPEPAPEPLPEPEPVEQMPTLANRKRGPK